MPSLKLFCTPTCIYLSNYCLAAMAPNHSSQGKYNYSSKTLTSNSQCPHCRKMYKSQGIKWHQSTCKMHNAEGQEAFALEFKRDQQSVLGSPYVWIHPLSLNTHVICFCSISKAHHKKTRQTATLEAAAGTSCIVVDDLLAANPESQADMGQGMVLYSILMVECSLWCFQHSQPVWTTTCNLTLETRVFRAQVCVSFFVS
jgi:hypothetical protein